MWLSVNLIAAWLINQTENITSSSHAALSSFFPTFSSSIRHPVDLKHGQEKETCERQSQAIMDTNICSHLRRHFSCFLCLSADWKTPTMDSQNVLTIWYMTLYKLLDLRIFTLIITLSVVTIIGLVCGTNSLDWKDLFDLSVHMTINVGRRKYKTFPVDSENVHRYGETDDLEQTNRRCAWYLVWVCWLDGLCSTILRLIGLVWFGLVWFGIV